MRKAIDNKLLDIVNVNHCSVPHLEEAELEDLYDKRVYGPSFNEEFGVDPRKRLKPKSRKKWSITMKKLFKEAGKPWNNGIKREIKNWLANFAANHAETILKEELVGPLENFIETVEAKLPK